MCTFVSVRSTYRCSTVVRSGDKLSNKLSSDLRRCLKPSPVDKSTPQQRVTCLTVRAIIAALGMIRIARVCMEISGKHAHAGPSVVQAILQVETIGYTVGSYSKNVET